MPDQTVDRRDFLKTAGATLALLMSERGLGAVPVTQEAPDGPPVKVAIVGLGPWGRELLSTLARQPFFEVAAICDSYAAALKRAGEIAPKAAAVADWRQALETTGLEAVIVATPSHLHKDIVTAALEAGRHVYCEMPLASKADEARAIALAGRSATRQIFQAGLQGRASALHTHVWSFVKAGVLGDPALVVGQWNRKDSWRRPGPTPEREAALNWRLDPKTSAGLPGEVGVHQFDLVHAYLNALPEAVTGTGSVTAWRDGREVPDTVSLQFELPRGIRFAYTATLASSFAGAYTVFEGSNSSVLVRDKRAWLIKEADSPLLGWEVYARKEPVHDETGIALVADATKILAAGKTPGEQGSVEPEQEALYLALQQFARAIRSGTPAAAGPLEGYQATVAAIAAHDASVAGTRIVLPSDAFMLD